MKRLLILTVAGLITACASIVSDSTYPVEIVSNPEGADFTVTNRSGIEVQRGTTPQVINLKASSGYFKSESYQIRLSKDGYAEEIYTLTSSVDGWYWGNILIGGLIGMLIVDPATGAMYKLPDRVATSLSASSAANEEESINILFATVDSLSTAQQSRLQAVVGD